MIGQSVMVDFGPDAYHSMIAFGLDYAPLRHLLISHSHQDHWFPEELYYRRKGFSVVAEGSMLTVHGNEQVAEKLFKALEEDHDYHLRFEKAQPFKEVELGDGLVAVPVIANHASDAEEALNWIVRCGEGAVLFGNDTGWYPLETWDFLSGMQLDVVFMDSTSGKIPARDHHLGCAVVVEVRDMMEKIGALSANARFIAVHFSHNGGMLHADLEEFYGPHGIEVAYDGMTVEI